MKKKIIEKIKAIINEIDSTTTGEMQLECSPVYKIISKDHCMLVESFNLDNVSVVEYVHEMVTHEFYVQYEDLTRAQLQEILTDLKEYTANTEA